VWHVHDLRRRANSHSTEPKLKTLSTEPKLKALAHSQRTCRELYGTGKQYTRKTRPAARKEHLSHELHFLVRSEQQDDQLCSLLGAEDSIRGQENLEKSARSQVISLTLDSR
jgi:hypothetical protein